MDKNSRIREPVDTVKWFLATHELVSTRASIVAAVSGGADSMALLHVLHKLSSELGFRLTAAHFDHRMRANSGDDMKRVKDYAASLGVSVFADGADVPEAARASGENVEQTARRLRYAFLSHVADEIGAGFIATGHTADDQAETVLMRVIRGTGIRGLRGIPARRGRVIRPFLTIDRARAIDYCRAHDVPYADDPTNSDTRLARNRIRHDLLPRLRDEYNPAIRDALVRLAGNADAAVERVRSCTNPLISSHFKKTGSDEWALNLSALAPLDATDLVVLFADLIVEHIGTDVDPSQKHFEELVRLVRDTRASGKRLSLPGLTVKREYEHLHFSRNVDTPAASATTLTTLTFPGETVTPKLKVTTEIIDGPSPNSFMCTKDTAYFSMRDLQLPLVIRGPETGDRMRPFGLDGTKKLSDIFSDRKVPGRLRRKSLVVADAREIVWLVGVTTSENSRIEDPREPIVRITVETNTEDAGV